MYLTLIFSFTDTTTTEIYTLSLHDALPISRRERRLLRQQEHHRLGDLLRGAWPPDRNHRGQAFEPAGRVDAGREDRESTRLNSSHANISYAVFCLKKQTKK